MLPLGQVAKAKRVHAHAMDASHAANVSQRSVCTAHTYTLPVAANMWRS